jgi:hypothetical protein
MKYEYTMLDGIKMGLNIQDNGIALDKEELEVLRRIFKKMKAVYYEQNKEYVISKPGNTSSIRIGLRQHHSNGDHWYLNIDGNPMNHFKEQNVYGYADAGRQIRNTFKACILWLSKRSKVVINESLYGKIEKGEINIHSLEFASYTKKLDCDIDQLINSWQAMYRLANWTVDGKTESLDRMLGISTRIDSEEYASSFALATIEKYQSRVYRVVGLRLYRKDVEIEETKTEVSAEILADVRQRLRVDIEFGSRWLHRKKIKTVKELETFVGINYDGDWAKFVRTELNDLIEKACLRYMWTFPNIFTLSEKAKIPPQWFGGVVDAEVRQWALQRGINPDISYKAHVSMVWARLSEQPGYDKLKALESPKAYAKSALRAYKQMDKLKNNQALAVAGLTFDRKEVAL